MKNIINTDSLSTVSNYEVAAKNIDGVILRIGYYDRLSSSCKIDSTFKQDYEGFSKQNVDIAFVWESKAVTFSDAETEAKAVVEYLDGVDVKLPIYMDITDEKVESVSLDQLIYNICGFCDYLVKEKGYPVGLKCHDKLFKFTSAITTIYDKKYSLWIKQETMTEPSYCLNYDGYQYSTRKVITGIIAPVCLSSFKTFSADKGETPSFVTGQLVALNNTSIYVRPFDTDVNVKEKKSGDFYIWSNKIIGNKVRITNTLDYVGKLGHVTGWIDVNFANYSKNIDVSVGDKVKVTGTLYESENGGAVSSVSNKSMIVTSVLDAETVPYSLGVAVSARSTSSNYTSTKNISK